MLLTDPVTKIPFIGNQYSTKLEKLEINSIGDLLLHFPFRYKDTSKIFKLVDLKREEERTVIAEVIKIKNIRLRSRKYIQKGIISDGVDDVEVVWFNQPYLTKNLRVGEKYLFSGKLDPKSTRPQLVSPEFGSTGDVDQSIHLGRIVPVYPLTQGIKQKWLRSRIHTIVSKISEFEDLEDYLPDSLKEKYDLIDIFSALRQIHFPEITEEISDSRKRIGFDELVNIQIKLIKQNNKRLKRKTTPIDIETKDITKFISKLSFKLTSSQIKAYSSIFVDFEKAYPMRRLLQGDVGSGKTIVSIIAALPVLSAGYQVVLLVPTAILAKQHFETISELIGDRYNISLHTSSTKKVLDKKLKVDFVIGTHAVLHSKEDIIENIGFLIIDEEHRFGVSQRRELISLKEAAHSPHILNMTATPIPRTLVLSLFGHLDISIIDKPKGRQEVNTYIVPSDKRDDSLSWINDILKKGGQAFWICPLIEENPEFDAKSVEEFYPQVKKSFSKYNTNFLHGKMKEPKKTKVLDDFRNQKLDILVSTTVIEVGIDIPSANIIIIESAQRYGLAQLHQLRGRVGRNNQKSWCLLFTEKEEPGPIRDRLKYFEKQTDGIKIAKYDLKMRGPGEVYGTVQSGLPSLKIANYSNLSLLKQSREAADELLNLTQP